MATTDTILLVEDDRFFLTIEKQFLRSAPVTVLEARTAEEALALCRAQKPQLVYLSYEIPGENGAVLCRRIKTDAQLRGTVVVMVCDAKRPEQTEQSRGAGCDGVVTKPLDRHRFLDVARSFLAGIREVRRSCLIRVRFKAQGQPLTAKGLDISRGGIFLETSVPLPAGEVLEMELQLSHFPDQGDWISCQGIVAWLNQRDKMFKPTHPVGLGIKFTGMPAESAGPLVQFLKAVGHERPGAASR